MFSFLKYTPGSKPGKRPSSACSGTTDGKASKACRKDSLKAYETKRVPRAFEYKWMDGRPWLRYDPDQGMTCQWCIDLFEAPQGKGATKSTFITGIYGKFLSLRIKKLIDHLQKITLLVVKCMLCCHSLGFKWLPQNINNGTWCPCE